ncbi:alginate O-acetyltransferase AlgX-related protein [Saccharothrix sp. Mg75]|uniref:alginate O-acetyltransferase AlgX-related protein n=1 Tax=Saccharothrix sp. Mg75 TaxID=3445357 RepID=UPI003EEF151C
MHADDTRAKPVVRSALPPTPESLLPRDHALYRPRHSDRQHGALVAAVVFFCVPALLLVVGVRPAEFENRKLADLPSITAGWGFFTGLNSWANDHIPFRDKAVAVDNAVNRLFGDAPPPPTKQRQDQPSGPIPLPPKDPSLDQPEPTAYVRAIVGKDDWLYLGDDVEDACEPSLRTDEVFARLAALRQAVEASGRKFVLTVAPNKSTVMPEYLPGRYFGKTCHERASDYFWRQLGPKTGAIDLRKGMKAEAERIKAPVYSKYDSHWTHDGGLVMVRAVVDAVQAGRTSSWKVEPSSKVERQGDLAPLLGRTEREEMQAYDVKPDGSTTRSRAVNGDPRQPQRFTQPAGKGVVGKKVGVLGDSFAFYTAQYLVAGFTDITIQHVDGVVADPRAVGRMLAGTDVVVLEAAERNLLGGINPILNPDAIGVIAEELAANPR